MNVDVRIIIAEVVVIMNLITISHDVMMRSETPKTMFDLGRKSTCTIENPKVNTYIVLTMLSRIHLG